MKTSAYRLCACLMAALWGWAFILAGTGSAAVPRKMNYQGKLTDASGMLVADGSYEMIFSIHDAATGGTQEWSETWDSGTAPVAVTNGLFNALLGAHTPIDLPFDEGYWLQMQVKYGGSYETLLPRQELASAGYAFRAEKVTDGAVGAAALADGAVTAAKIDVPALDSAGKISELSSTTVTNLGGANITNLNATNIASGNVSAARLPTGGEWALTSPLGITGGKVGIGTTEPIGKLEVSSSTADARAVRTLVTATSGTNYGVLGQAYGAGAAKNVGLYGYATGAAANWGLFVEAGDAIFNSNVGIGTTAPAAKLEVAGTNVYQYFTVASDAANIEMLRQRRARGTISSPSIVQSGDALAELIGLGYDGSNYRDSARVRVEVDGTPGTNDMPGRITFSTSPDGVWALAERMRIDSSGNVGVGTTAPAAALNVRKIGGSGAIETLRLQSGSGSSGDGPAITFYDADTSSAAQIASAKGAANTAALVFHTANGGSPAERMRIDNTGGVGIGTSAPVSRLHVKGSGSTAARLVVEDPAVGSCSYGPHVSGGNSCSSDIRLKKNIKGIDNALEKLSSVKGVSFDWKNSTSHEPKLGVIAQEIEKVFPELVSTDEYGYKSVSYAGLVVPLIEAVKELRLENVALRREIAALQMH